MNMKAITLVFGILLGVALTIAALFVWALSEFFGKGSLFG